jgi:general secretion pathway protein C
MGTWLRRSFWILDFGTVGLCALLLGHTVAVAVADILWPATVATNPAVATARLPVPAPDKETESIVARNVFCSACRPAAAQASDASPRRSLLPLRLVATNVAAAPWSARHSSAVLRDAESQQVGTFGLHDRVKGAVLKQIEATRVELDNQGQREFLDLLESATEGEGLRPEERPAPPSARDALAQAVEQGVRKLGAHSYEIDRSALEAMLGDLGALSLSARAVPESREGRPAGIRFVGVRPGGALAKLGIENGDLVSSVNGLELTSAEQGLAVYTKLRSAGHVAVGLERGGRRLSHEYRIR